MNHHTTTDHTIPEGNPMDDWYMTITVSRAHRDGDSTNACIADLADHNEHLKAVQEKLLSDREKMRSTLKAQARRIEQQEGQIRQLEGQNGKLEEAYEHVNAQLIRVTDASLRKANEDRVHTKRLEEQNTVLREELVRQVENNARTTQRVSELESRLDALPHVQGLTADQYQRDAARTLLDAPGFDLTPQEFMLVWNAIGLAGEAGEVAETIKKGILHRHGLDVEKLEKELGDTQWYLAGLATKAQLRLSDIMQKNINKLRQRYPDGFSSRDSQRRVDLNGNGD